MAKRTEQMTFTFWSDPNRVNSDNGSELDALFLEGWRTVHRSTPIGSGTAMMAPIVSQILTLERTVDVPDDDAAAGPATARSSSSRRAAAVAASGSASVAGAGPAAGIAAGFDLALFGRHLAAAVAGAGAGVASGFGASPHHQAQQQRPLTRSEQRRVTLTERWGLIGDGERARYGDLDCYLAWHAGIDAGQIVEGCGALSFDGSRSGT